MASEVIVMTPSRQLICCETKDMPRASPAVPVYSSVDDGNHCDYAWRDGQAEFTWVADIPVLTGPDIKHYVDQEQHVTTKPNCSLTVLLYLYNTQTK